VRSGIRCTLMRGGTSKGAYFLASDLPQNPAERDDLLLRIMGSPDPRQIDGLGGSHPLTSKVAIVGPSRDDSADIEFLFAQVSIEKPTVDTTPNCGNILAGVAPFAIERGLVTALDPATRVRVKILNTGTRAELIVCTPGGEVSYSGSERIDGVPGTAAAIPINFLDAEGSVCGALLPTGNVVDIVCGVAVTCVDQGMPVVILRAKDMGFAGSESCAEIEAAKDPNRGCRIDGHGRRKRGRRAKDDIDFGAAAKWSHPVPQSHSQALPRFDWRFRSCLSCHGLCVARISRTRTCSAA
jgi:4-oxalomesaconate tautomerase